MKDNVLKKLITEQFVKDNYKFTTITGLIIIILYIIFGTSLILIFFVDWWWKLSILSGGLFLLVRQTIKHKVDLWIDELSKKN